MPCHATPCVVRMATAVSNPCGSVVIFVQHQFPLVPGKKTQVPAHNNNYLKDAHLSFQTCGTSLSTKTKFLTDDVPKCLASNNKVHVLHKGRKTRTRVFVKLPAAPWQGQPAPRQTSGHPPRSWRPSRRTFCRGALPSHSRGWRPARIKLGSRRTRDVQTLVLHTHAFEKNAYYADPHAQLGRSSRVGGGGGVRMVLQVIYRQFRCLAIHDYIEVCTCSVWGGGVRESRTTVETPGACTHVLFFWFIFLYQQ